MTDEPISPGSLDERERECEAILRYEFRDRELLRLCLTHASAAKTRLASNERLEFLGDAVLGLAVCEALFHRFPNRPEGELTHLKSTIVSRHTCAEVASRLGLDRLMLVGKGVIASGAMPGSIKAAVVEALVAGVYLDGGLQAAHRVIERLFEPDIERAVRDEHARNYKSLLQQLSQRTSGETPAYQVLDEKGPDHSKCFQVSAMIGSQVYPAAWGPSKKEAEQNAARNALLELGGEDVLDEDDLDDGEG